jgi:hypothetical protein
LKYHHIGIPTQKIQDKETYLEKYKLFCTDHTSNPYGIQWMRYEASSPLPEVVKTVPHVAFEVEDLDMALEGKNVIIAPNSPSAGVKVAFIMEDGAPIEFIEYQEK